MKNLYKTIRYGGFAGAAVLSALCVAMPAQAADRNIGDIFMTGANFCPQGSLPLAGQLLPISNYQALFSLLGPTYGGDARVTFGLPDARGRTLIGVGTGPGLQSFARGNRGGSEQTSLTQGNLPTHSHGLLPHTHSAKVEGSQGGPDVPGPSGASVATFPNNVYSSQQPTGAATMAEGTVTVSSSPPSQTTNAGASQPFALRSPYLAVQACIAVEGDYPPRP